MRYTSAGGAGRHDVNLPQTRHASAVRMLTPRTIFGRRQALHCVLPGHVGSSLFHSILFDHTDPTDPPKGSTPPCKHRTKPS